LKKEGNKLNGILGKSENVNERNSGSAKKRDDNG